MGQIITFLICCAMAAMFLYVGTTQFWQQRRNMAHAEPVDAVIVHSGVKTSTTRDTDQRVGFSNNTTSHLPEVRFRYSVSGMEHESERLYPTIIERAYASESAAREVLAPFPLNAKVRAYVNESHPDQAFLILESSKGPVVFLVLGVILPPVGWFVGQYV
jgi:hypothetical protein